MPRSPLPVRNGLNSAWVRTPNEGEWCSMRDFLVDKIPRLTPERIDEMFAEQRFVDEQGVPISADAPYINNRFIFYHRDLPVEYPPPGELNVVYEDERIVVLDKPHFMSTIPRGRHVLYSATVIARRKLDLPELSPAHRLDRLTAGLLLCTKYQRYRAAYQTMFERREVAKTYQAIAGVNPNLDLPCEVKSHIAKYRGVIRAVELPDKPVNAHTLVELVETKTDSQGQQIGNYKITPYTGRTHQIRIHLNSLGIPILGDSFYPVLLDQDVNDFSNPLQLLAKTLAFIDPITGEQLKFTSASMLEAWQ